MNRILYTGLVIGIAAMLFNCQKSGQYNTSTKEVSLVTSADTVSYLVGHDIARSLKSIEDEIVLDVVVSGMKEMLAGKESRIPADRERTIMQAFGTKMNQKRMAVKEAEGEKNQKAAKEFLEENGKKEGVVTTASGLQYSVMKQGNGPIPGDSAKVKVHYEGKLLSGKVFDSSIKRGKPAVFGINNVIKGWTEALKLMKVGSKYKLFIPPELAYGQRGMAHDIGPNMMLIFEVELLGIEK